MIALWKLVQIQSDKVCTKQGGSPGATEIKEAEVCRVTLAITSPVQHHAGDFICSRPS